MKIDQEITVEKKSSDSVEVNGGQSQESNFPFAYMQIDNYFEIKTDQASLLTQAERWVLSNRKTWVFKSSITDAGMVRITRVK